MCESNRFNGRSFVRVEMIINRLAQRNFVKIAECYAFLCDCVMVRAANTFVSLKKMKVEAGVRMPFLLSIVFISSRPTNSHCETRFNPF